MMAESNLSENGGDNTIKQLTAGSPASSSTTSVGTMPSTPGIVSHLPASTSTDTGNNTVVPGTATPASVVPQGMPIFAIPSSMTNSFPGNTAAIMHVGHGALSHVVMATTPMATSVTPGLPTVTRSQ